MEKTGNCYTEWGNPDPKRQTPYVLLLVYSGSEHLGFSANLK